jgi:hypothetical protein
MNKAVRFGEKNETKWAVEVKRIYKAKFIHMSNGIEILIDYMNCYVTLTRFR